MNSVPAVSIVVPCRNETRFISGFIDSVLNNGYPVERLELLIVDGMSEDGTRSIVQSYSERYPQVRLIDNSHKVTPYALNIGIRGATHEIIMRLDAHSICRPDYISRCVHVLEEYDADDVGGTWRMVPRDDTPVGRAIVRATANRVGVGNVRYRLEQPDKPRIVDTIPFFCCRRELFGEIGMFNEKLTRIQDMEFKRRLTRAGYKIMLAPGAVVDYQSRSDLKTFARHNWADGVWTVLAFAHSEVMPVRWRHLAPLCLVGTVLACAAAATVIPLFGWALAGLVGLYAAFVVYAGAAIARSERDFKYAYLVPVVVATMHGARGAGSLWGIVRVLRAGKLLRAARLVWQEFGLVGGAPLSSLGGVGKG